MSSHQLTLSQTQTPFPFGPLAASSYLNSQKDLQANVHINWERDGKLAFDGKDVDAQQALDALAGAFSGNEVRSTRFCWQSLLVDCLVLIFVAIFLPFFVFWGRKQTAFPTLPTPFTSTVAFAQVNQIFDALDDWLALRSVVLPIWLSHLDIIEY